MAGLSKSLSEQAFKWEGHQQSHWIVSISFLPWYLCRTPKGNTEGILLPVTKEEILWCSEGQTFISKTFVYSRHNWLENDVSATYTRKHVVESIMTLKELKTN